nr:hypothetical protein [Tanacetum cinerariifolium]
STKADSLADACRDLDPCVDLPALLVVVSIGALADSGSFPSLCLFDTRSGPAKGYSSLSASSSRHLFRVTILKDIARNCCWKNWCLACYGYSGNDGRGHSWCSHRKRGHRGNDDDDDQEVERDDDKDDEEESRDDDQEYDDEYAEDTRDEEIFDPIPQTPKNSDDEGNGEEDLGLNVGGEEGHVEEDEEDFHVHSMFIPCS